MAVEETADNDVGIMPSNWESFLAFIACQTQWRMVAGLSGVIWQGLDYIACRFVLDELKAAPHVFSDIRFMEIKALPILNEVD